MLIKIAADPDLSLRGGRGRFFLLALLGFLPSAIVFLPKIKGGGGRGGGAKSLLGPSSRTATEKSRPLAVAFKTSEHVICT